jgi:hypothetical protein
MSVEPTDFEKDLAMVCKYLKKGDFCEIKQRVLPKHESYCLRYCNNPNYMDFEECKWKINYELKLKEEE